MVLKLKNSSNLAKYPQLQIEIPYGRISGLRYEYYMEHRVVAGNLLSLGSWYSWTYKTSNNKKDSIVLRIDKQEAQFYRSAVPQKTGLELTEHIEEY